MRAVSDFGNFVAASIDFYAANRQFCQLLRFSQMHKNTKQRCFKDSL